MGKVGTLSMAHKGRKDIGSGKTKCLYSENAKLEWARELRLVYRVYGHTIETKTRFFFRPCA